MNQKHAREARIVNRVVGILVKKRELPIAENGATIIDKAKGHFHKLGRDVKRMFERRTHKQKGRTTLYWRSGVAHSLKARGITPKGERPGGAPRASVRAHTNPPSRSVRVNDRKILNQFQNEIRQHANRWGA